MAGTRIRKGMPVYSADGQHLGRVIRVEQPGGPGPDVKPSAWAERQASAGGQEIDAGAGPEPLLGATTPKDRGDPTTMGEVAGRGDPESLDPTREPAEPGSGGANLLRGLGVPASDAPASVPQHAARSATGELSGGGTTEMRVAGRRPEPRPGPPEPQPEGAPTERGGRAQVQRAPTPPSAAEGAVLIEAAGVFGVGAGGLRVPLTAVLRADKDRLVLDGTAEQIRQRYGRRGLEIDERADVLPY